MNKTDVYKLVEQHWATRSIKEVAEMCQRSESRVQAIAVQLGLRKNPGVFKASHAAARALRP